MSMLITVKTLPPGGWRFEQKTKDGRVVKMDGMGPFWDHIKTIQTYRKANGIVPDDEQSISFELQAYTCQRLGNDPKWCDSEKKTLWRNLSALPAHVRVAAQRVGSVSDGARILVDWLGEGMVPVEITIANRRAAVCLECPENLESHGIMRLTDKIAQAIIEQRRKKSELGLKVDGEANLFTCRVCACHLPLKVHVPMKTIMGRTKPEALNNFPPHCWMRTENQTQNPEPKESNEPVDLLAVP